MNGPRSSSSPGRGPEISCCCGCGAILRELDNRGRPRNGLAGHASRGKPRPWAVKETVQWRSSHERANKIKKEIRACEWLLIGGCHGPLDVAHVDQDEFNNDPPNLRKLCRRHHQLLDRGYLNPVAPRMPQPHVFPNGRYIWPNNRQYPQWRHEGAQPRFRLTPEGWRA